MFRFRIFLRIIFRFMFRFIFKFMLRFILKFMCQTHTQAFLVPQSLQIQGGLLDDTQSDSVPMFNLNCLDLNILAAHLACLQTESLLMGWHWFQHVIIDIIVIYPTAHSRCNDSWFLTLPRAQNRLPKLIKRELAELPWSCKLLQFRLSSSSFRPESARWTIEHVAFA